MDNSIEAARDQLAKWIDNYDLSPEASPGTMSELIDILEKIIPSNDWVSIRETINRS